MGKNYQIKNPVISFLQFSVNIVYFKYGLTKV